MRNFNHKKNLSMLYRELNTLREETKEKGGVVTFNAARDQRALMIKNGVEGTGHHRHNAKTAGTHMAGRERQPLRPAT